jgi:cytochrome c oxidase cbb3-type subunit 3
MQQSEVVLSDARGKFINKIREYSVDELLANADLSEFIFRAGKVPFADNCAGCHGQSGSGISQNSDIAPVLNDDAWLHGGQVQAIKASIQNPLIHPFGLVKRIDEVSAKILAVYVYKFGGGVKPA